MTFGLDVLSAIGVLVIVVLGLAIVLGVLDVINLAHTGFMAVGVYTAVTVTHHGLPFWAGLLGAVVVSALVGLAVELLVIRRLYARPLETILATWGLSLVIIQVLTLAYGHNNQALGQPINGSIAGYPSYRLLLVLIGAVLVVALAVLLRYTRAGLTVRMVQSNDQLARGLGIRVALIRGVTFVAGCALAGFAGALLGPTQAINPNYAVSLVAAAFMAVLMAGRRLSGLVLACVLLAAVQVLFGRLFNPVYSSTAMIAVAVIALRVRPEGLTWQRA
ncbi:MAG: branched-chain amino acid ABC transporter permease [Actinoallomurus sp.]